MFHPHPSDNGPCGSNGLSPLKACAIQPLRATLGATAETNCLGLGQRARLRHDRNLARSAGRGEGCQARKVSRPYRRRASHHRSTALSEWIGVSVRTTFRLELVVLPMRTDRPRRPCRLSIPLARSGHHLPCDARASQPKRAYHKTLSHKAHRPRRRAGMRPFDPVPRSTAMIH
jgi:hypothetical protein